MCMPVARLEILLLRILINSQHVQMGHRKEGSISATKKVRISSTKQAYKELSKVSFSVPDRYFLAYPGP